MSGDTPVAIRVFSVLVVVDVAALLRYFSICTVSYDHLHQGGIDKTPLIICIKTTMLSYTPARLLAFDLSPLRSYFANYLVSSSIYPA